MATTLPMVTRRSKRYFVTHGSGRPGHIRVMALCDVIRKRRTDLGLTQDQIAAAVGVDRSAVSQWEGAGQRKKVKRPDMDRIVPLAAALQMTVGDLLEEPGNTSALKLDTRGPDEVALLSLFRMMKPRQRRNHLALFYTTAGFPEPVENLADPGESAGGGASVSI